MPGADESLGVLCYGAWADGVDSGRELMSTVSADEDGSGYGLARGAYGEVLTSSTSVYAYESCDAW